MDEGTAKPNQTKHSWLHIYIHVYVVYKYYIPLLILSVKSHFKLGALALIIKYEWALRF